ncbi:MAG TPA: hypothetical protein VMR21_11495 [Vicinamibacteria bacterium]|nr:hypothetical protein [Vicinamibacteria bacterium]
MKPPPISEALDVAWNTLKKDPMPIVLGVLCAMLLGCIPLVGGGLAFAGFMRVGLKALRGAAPEPADGFVGLQQRPLDHIVMGLLQIVGLLACCVGVYVSQGVFFPGTGLVLEKEMDWSRAKDVCIERIGPDWGAWTLYALVMSLVGASGAILCGVGVIATAPVAALALAYAYERTLAAGAY